MTPRHTMGGEGMKIEFRPSVEAFGGQPIVATEAAIASEPMIYGGSWGWCRDNAGPITNQVMNRICDSVLEQIEDHALRGYHPVIDTKSVLLMPGQYPCIPGLHCDGVVRKDRESQPDLSTIHDSVWHYTCAINGTGDPVTEFVNAPCEIDIDRDAVWKSVESQSENCSTFKGESGRIYTFKRDQLHRGGPAQTRGWRYFFRLSFYHMPAMNQIRKQVQVYTTVEQGW